VSVAFLNLQRLHAELDAPLSEAVLRALRSGYYIGGPEVEAFEGAFAAYCGATYCVGVGNGLDALHLALRALCVGAGDEVIVPSNTFIATWLAVSQVGARCVPVEPDDGDFQIDPARIEAAITVRTKVIIPVHLYGHPADLEAIGAIARRHGLAVLEDAAQAHGALYRGRRIGGHGNIVAWSFYPGKNLGAIGDGGAVTCDDPALAEKLRLLRNYGSRERYRNEVPGYNSRLDPIQAAVLATKLPALDRWNARRQAIAARYQAAFADTALTLPKVRDSVEPVWHLYCVRHPQRDRLRALLAEAGIETLIHYPIPPHLQIAYADLGLKPGALPIAEQMSAQLCSLPIDPTMEDSDVEQVIAAVRGALAMLAA
jgi:dTDP-4-amino-4,6-dideoxygalactose transaminase